MREILFRGKRIDNDEWVEGGIDTDWGVSAAERERYWIDRPYLGKISVIPETVGQYTGLTDKNGTMIFEGDILAIGENGKRYQTVSVSFKDGAFRVSHYAINLLESRNIESEIIGNIHDNPELLKGGAENA